MGGLTNFLENLLGRSRSSGGSRSSAARKKIARLQVPPPSESHPHGVYKKGDFIGKNYEVLGVLGLGGFSVVYLVYSHESETPYALKTLRDQFLRDEETREQFRKEAKLWMHLERHPHIVSASFVEELAGRLYIGMEYIAPNEEGLNSLEGYFNRNAPDLHQSLRWAIQFCHGMEYAHERGIRCHRDVKPANIMITQEKMVKITDFGFADVIDASRARLRLEAPFHRRRGFEEETGFGTPAYMPPEQFRNAVRCDERSDIYSFGVVLYQMASRGRIPFAEAIRGAGVEHDAAQMWKEMHRLHTEASPAPLASPLYPVAQRCMQKEPSKRYPSFRELRNELDELMKRQTGETLIPHQTKDLEAWELYNKAFSLGSLGQLEEAIAYYDRVLELEPKNTNAWNNRGVCCKKLGRTDEALRCYDRAVEADRHNGSAWSNKGSLLYSLGRFTEAIVHLNKALAIDPTNESSWLNRAMAEDRLGLSEEAIQSYQKFVELKPVQLAPHVEYARRRMTELRSATKRG
jgi:eukaryotic-like serine/threonine-protein kinase